MTNGNTDEETLGEIKSQTGHGGSDRDYEKAKQRRITSGWSDPHG